MDADSRPEATRSPTRSRALPEHPFVSLTEAITWIAFGDSMMVDDLQAQLKCHRPLTADSAKSRLHKFFTNDDSGSPDVPGTEYFVDRQSGLEQLANAWEQIRHGVDGELVKVRGRFSESYSLADARLQVVEELGGKVIATFSQFDVSTGGIRRPLDALPGVLWENHPDSYDREFQAFSDEIRAADGYLLVEVKRTGLIRAFPHRYPSQRAQNRQLDRNAIMEKAAAMLGSQPGLSKGSAAASIVSELPANPRTGKPRDTRHIERMIAHLWEGGLPESPP